MTSRSLGSPFWRLFVSLSGSNLADGIGRTALPLLATTLTRDPLPISGLVTLALGPPMLSPRPARHRPETAAGFAETPTLLAMPS